MVRKLKGFQKHHHVPDNYSDAAQNFVKNCGNEDIKTLADDLYLQIRSSFGYKRREFDYTCDAGEAWIKTPDFDASLRIEQSEVAPKEYIIYSELVKLHNESIASDQRLHHCFNAHCDALVVSLISPINVEDKIDAIEEIEALRSCLSYEPDGTSFELKLKDLDLHIQVDAFNLRFSLLTLRNMGKLIDHSQRAFEILTECGFELKLNTSS